MLCELGAVVECDGAAQRGRQRAEDAAQAEQHVASGLGGLTGDAEQAGAAFVGDQDGLTVTAEQHQVGLPMAGLGAVVGASGSAADGDTVWNEVHGAGAAPAWSATAVLAAGQ